MEHWKIIEDDAVNKGRFKAHLQQLLLPGGEQVEYSYVEVPENICILPILGEQQVVCLKQYRHPIKDWLLELPAGMIDEGESPEEAAGRELQEETGYRAGTLVPLGTFFPSPGATTEKVHVFLAEGLTRAEESPDRGEELQVKIFNLRELFTLIKSGQFQHGAGLVAIAYYLMYKEI